MDISEPLSLKCFNAYELWVLNNLFSYFLMIIKVMCSFDILKATKINKQWTHPTSIILLVNSIYLNNSSWYSLVWYVVGKRKYLGVFLHFIIIIFRVSFFIPGFNFLSSGIMILFCTLYNFFISLLCCETPTG